MPSHIHLAHRRNAKLASRNRTIVLDKSAKERAEECVQNFPMFCSYVCGKEPAEHHLEWIKELVTEEDSQCLHRIAGPNTAILAPRGPLEISTKVATPDGWKRIGELEYEDIVYTEEGKPTAIIGIDDFEGMPCYEIAFSDGNKITCDEDHTWKVRKLNSDKWENKRTSELVKEKYVFYEVPVCKAVEYPEIKTTVDPYRFGMLICDCQDIQLPFIYTKNSIRYRTRILQGVLDVLGSVKQGEIVLRSKSNIFTKTIRDLVHSLGGTTDLKSEVKTHVIKIQLGKDFAYFTVPEKKQIKLDETKVKPQRTLFNIRHVGKRNVRCIEVEDTFSNFICDNYIVSNNSAKSTVLGMFTAWAIGIHAMRNMSLKILYLSYTVDVSRPKSATIKRIVESKRYAEVFPTVRIQKGVSSNEYWSIDYRFAKIDEIGDEVFSLCCAGLKGSVTSKRSMLVIIDDAIKSADDIKNADIRREMQDNWNQVIEPTMFEGARAICLGTRFRHDDIFATTFIPGKGWKQIVQQAIVCLDDGTEESYWPGMWSLKYLKDKKLRSPIAFSFQYMNQIVRQSEISLPPELLIKGDIATEFDTIGIGVDLSSGMNERNDYTVFTLGGRLGDRVHIIDYARFRAMGNLEKLDKMMEMLAEWNLLIKQDNDYFPTYSTCNIWSEAVQYQASLEADFKRICLYEKDLNNLKWHPVSGFRSDKLVRFRGIMGMFEQKKILFNKYRNFSSMFDELINFGASSHDDCVDSLVHLVNGLTKKGALEVDWD